MDPLILVVIWSLHLSIPVVGILFLGMRAERRRLEDLMRRSVSLLHSSTHKNQLRRRY